MKLTQLEGTAQHSQKLVSVSDYRPSHCLFNALGLDFQRFLESGRFLRIKLFAIKKLSFKFSRT